MIRRAEHPPEHAAKFRQAAVVYLHYAVLYEIGAYVLWQEGLFPATRGPEAVWFLAGAAIAAVVVWALWWGQWTWLAHAIWILLALRLPTLMEGAFLGGGVEIPSGLYLAAGLVVLVAMGAVARAAWDV